MSKAKSVRFNVAWLPNVESTKANAAPALAALTSYQKSHSGAHGMATVNMTFQVDLHLMTFNFYFCLFLSISKSSSWQTWTIQFNVFGENIRDHSEAEANHG